MNWTPHGHDYMQRRGRWTMLVRKMRDGWDYLIKIGDVRVALSARAWDRLDEAQSACMVHAVTLAAELLEEPCAQS